MLRLCVSLSKETKQKTLARTRSRRRHRECERRHRLATHSARRRFPLPYGPRTVFSNNSECALRRRELEKCFSFFFVAYLSFISL